MVTLSYGRADLTLPASGTGILWGQLPDADSDNGPTTSTLYAYNAETLVEIWDSNQVPGDQLGTYMKFATPILLSMSAFEDILRFLSTLFSVGTPWTSNPGLSCTLNPLYLLYLTIRSLTE